MNSICSDRIIPENSAPSFSIVTVHFYLNTFLMNHKNTKFKFYQYQGNRLHSSETEVIEEASVKLTVNGEDWLTFMCTPIKLEELAIGFLFNEKIIGKKDEIEAVQLCASGTVLDVWLTKSVSQPSIWKRTSGCTGGITTLDIGKFSERSSTSKNNNIRVTPDSITRLVELLFESQELYRRAGGVHTSALCNSDEISVSMEDIGRHNTLDKIAGFCILEDLLLNKPIIITTGRISSEMLQKSIRLGASIVVSRTSPSSLSVVMAEKFGITLIGYARRRQFNLYTHPERIIKD